MDNGVDEAVDVETDDGKPLSDTPVLSDDWVKVLVLEELGNDAETGAVGLSMPSPLAEGDRQRLGSTRLRGVVGCLLFKCRLILPVEPEDSESAA